MPLTLKHNNLILWHIAETREKLEALLGIAHDPEISDHRALERHTATRLTREFCNSDIAHDPDGAPYLTASDQCISISHTTDYLALKFSNAPCALDIEHLDRDARRIARKFTDATEIAIAAEALPANPELLIWCAKETLYKLVRRAGAEFLTDFRLLQANETQLLCSSFGRNIALKFAIYNNILIVENYD